MSTQPVIEFMVRIDGEVRYVPLADLLTLRVNNPDGSTVRVMPGTAARCFSLGAQALVEEMSVGPEHEVAGRCRNPQPKARQG